MPHRLELWESQARISAAGYETWYAEMVEQYSCQNCGTINSAYDRGCRKCGTTPSCNFVKAHEDEVAKLRSKMGPL
jgi:ribosomal protein L40E